MLWFYILIFIASCLLLIKSGTWLVHILISIAKDLKLTEFLVAFILMAFATSVPELFVGIMSAIHKQPELSFGNIIGSNIINFTLAVAIGVFVAKGLKCGGAIIRRTSIYTLIIALLPIILMVDGNLSRIDGIILLLALAVYVQRLFYHRERFTKVFDNALDNGTERFKRFLKNFGMFFAGIFLLLLSAEGIVWSSTHLAATFNMPLIIIGTVLVALGTNLPEIVFGVKAITMGHKDMVLGNLLGSVVANSTLVLGITVLIYPLEISDFSPYIIGIVFVVLSALLFTIFSRIGKEITRKEAFVLLLVYISFVAIELLVK